MTRSAGASNPRVRPRSTQVVKSPQGHSQRWRHTGSSSTFSGGRGPRTTKCTGSPRPAPASPSTCPRRRPASWRSTSATGRASSRMVSRSSAGPLPTRPECGEWRSSSPKASRTSVNVEDRDEPRPPLGRMRWRRSGTLCSPRPSRARTDPFRGRRHRLSAPTSSCRCRPSRAGWRASRRAGRRPPGCHCRRTPSGPRCSRLTGAEALARRIRTRSRV
jgi:hypothetical protein